MICPRWHINHPKKIKKWQVCKPGSVLFENNSCHLSGILLTQYLLRPTLRVWASNPLTPVYLVFQRIRFTPCYSYLKQA
jgi:hypothetical protein